MRNIISRIRGMAVELVLDAALTAVLRLRRTIVPPKPIVWREPRPYRRWPLDELARELELLRVRRDQLLEHQLWDAHVDDVEYDRCLVLDEILTKCGLRLDAPQIHDSN